MARRHHHNSISLFPFLAVLVCAMGALILLLLITSRKIRQDLQVDLAAIPTMNSAAVVETDRSAEIDDLKIQIRAAEEAVSVKLSQAEALQGIVNERRDQAESAQHELDDLKLRLIRDETGSIQTSVAETLKGARELSAKEAALLRRLKESEKQLLEKQQILIKATDDAKAAQMILHEKNSALISLRTQVKKAQEEQKTNFGSATLLEFSNSTGTTRTPIVVDVSDSGFEVLPNGTAITNEDMEGFPVRDNPLLSAILTTHRHRSKNSVTDEPYVLLLVRPDGCLAFYGAQRILIEAGIHYGYELLEPDRTIVAGEPDPSETPVVRVAMEEAFRRRENLYRKLMAIAQQREGIPGGDGEPAGGSGERRLTMRPDGRILVDEPAGQRPLDGRYYAGGVAPPSSLLHNRPPGGYRGLNPDRLSPGDAEKLADQFAERYAAQQAGDRFSANAGVAPSVRTTPSRPPEVSGGDDAFRSAGERKFADSIFGSDGSLQSSRLAGSVGDGRVGGGGNPGTVGPAGSSGVAATSVEPAQASSPTAEYSFSQTQAGTTFSDVPVTAQAAQSGTNSEDSDWLQSSLLSGGAGSTSSTTGQPNKTASGTSTNSLLSAGEPGDSPSTGIPDLSRIDADLLRRLPSGQKQSGSMSSPVGIVVFLDERHMTISQQPAVAVTQDTLDAAFATLIQGIHTEVEDARRKPNEPLMPIVKFIVSPGGEKWRIPLAYSLKRMGIHTVAIFELTPYITSSDRTGRARLDDSNSH